MAWRIASAFMVALIGQATFAEDPPPPADGTVPRRHLQHRDCTAGGPASSASASQREPTGRRSRSAKSSSAFRPDVILLCEIDYAPETDPPRMLVEKYLAKPQAEGLDAIKYSHRFTAPVNTGVPSGLDLDRDGSTDGPADAWGFGRYPGQYGMALLSRFPIDEEATRTFQNVLWKDLPHNRMPVDPTTSGLYYSDSVWNQLRLPSKSFWDVAVRSPFGRLRALCSHPTPPVFDGPEDRNGCRNADEIELVTRYIEDAWLLEQDESSRSVFKRRMTRLPRPDDWVVDDSGRAGGLASREPFVVLGDLNADPYDGDGQREAIRGLLSSPRLAGDPAPTSWGAVASSHAEAETQLPAQRTSRAGHRRFQWRRPRQPASRLRFAIRRPRGGRDRSLLPRLGDPGAEAVKASDHRAGLGRRQAARRRAVKLKVAMAISSQPSAPEWRRRRNSAAIVSYSIVVFHTRMSPIVRVSKSIIEATSPVNNSSCPVKKKRSPSRSRVNWSIRPAAISSPTLAPARWSSARAPTHASMLSTVP